MMSVTDETDISDKIKIISINDSNDEPQEPHIPSEQEIVDEITAMWKEDPSSETLGATKLYLIIKERKSHWTISAKRLKLVLRSNGLSPSGGNEQFTYTDEISSSDTPNLKLPSGIKIRRNDDKGKSLIASKSARAGEILWKERPVFFVPPLVNANLIKFAKACSYCGQILVNSRTDSSGAAFLKGLDCSSCAEVWCSDRCKKSDILHTLLKHKSIKKNNTNKSIDPEAYLELQDYCLKEQWNSLYAITYIYAYFIADETGIKRDQFWSLAQVSQDIRHKALTSSAGAFDTLQGGALPTQEQQEEFWKTGYKLFSDVFPNSVITYEEFMKMLGTYNLNNFDSNIYLLQSHLNHDCDPNVFIETSADSRTEGIKVFVKSNIRANQELTISYVRTSHAVQQRRRELRVNWGFVCDCSKCKEDLKAQQRRKSSSGGSYKETKSDIKQMLEKTKEGLEDGSLTLNIPLDFVGERRKSVRFDEKVVAVEE